jgi:hypothetical protein
MLDGFICVLKLFCIFITTKEGREKEKVEKSCP